MPDHGVERGPGAGEGGPGQAGAGARVHQGPAARAGGAARSHGEVPRCPAFLQPPPTRRPREGKHVCTCSTIYV